MGQPAAEQTIVQFEHATPEQIPLGLLPPTARLPEGLEVSIRVHTYPVDGSRATHLRESVAKRGPERHGASFPSYTDWSLSWTYLPGIHGRGIRPSAVRVRVAAACVIPLWRRPPRVRRALRERWNAFMAGVAVHERGHLDLAVAAGHAVLEALHMMPPQRSVDALDEVTRSQIPALMVAIRSREERYDEVTLHGAKQGLVLP